MLERICIQYYLSHLFHHVSSQQEFSKEEGANISGGREMRVRISNSSDGLLQTKAALIWQDSVLCSSLTLIYYIKVAGKYEH